ncbi:class I SAM-dependent methyltransferase [Jejuia spongiicola]|uniref:Class I SAM-dependent methyltransferase n=1 Tax=Jejuia spongiicola TaxID=2942207 RepID=A0ABT0QA14_9FLAO|nr:class I SAM-dependent methyltransferase [Jejuia spongiicola]MCL6293739.1 class I SAM-dependent methyltransferase [Jejuia spongiicola]
MEGKYYKTKESVEEYIKLAKGFNGAQLIEKLKKFLPLNSTLLEIGSGPGSDWSILNKSYKTTGSDNSDEFLSYLNAKNATSEFLNLDATTLRTEKKFDSIYSNKVMHHLTDDELIKSIKRQYEILNADGVICHSFWKGEGSEIFKGLFVNYHSEKSLRRFYKGNFEILLIEDYKEFDDDDSILLIAKKK